MFRKDCIPYQTETSSYLHFRDAARDVQFHSEMTLDTSEMCYWLKVFLNNSEALPSSGLWQDISMKFLCSLVRWHFVEKWAVVLQSEGDFSSYWDSETGAWSTAHQWDSWRHAVSFSLHCEPTKDLSNNAED